MKTSPVIFLFLICTINEISSSSSSSSSVEISKSKACEEDENNSAPCSSESIVVQTDPLHGFIISVLPFKVRDDSTKGKLIEAPKPYKLEASVEEILTSEEELFVIDKSFSLMTTSSTINEPAGNSTTVNESSTEEECTINCPESCERTYQEVNLTLFTSSCGMNYSNSIEFCKDNGGEIFIPRHQGYNELIFNFGADFYNKSDEYEFFWYPLKRPTYGDKAVWADGSEFETYDTPFIGDSNSNQFRCFVFKKDGDSLSTYDQFCRVTNARPVCDLYT